MGNAKLRHKLWMPTLRAAVHNPWLNAHYERLRKLLGAIYSVAKDGKPFVPHVTNALAKA